MRTKYGRFVHVEIYHTRWIVFLCVILFICCFISVSSSSNLASVCLVLTTTWITGQLKKYVHCLFCLFVKLCQFSFTMYHVDVFICVRTKPTCFCVPCQNFAALKTFITTVFTLLQPAGDSADYEDMADDIIEFESSLAGVCFFIFIVIF